ncbi:MAG TPA: methylmalonyl-CoA mutase family protein, partial [Chitinophagaceae bacterium]|nr:methylmalonyl-CoA mutase family protein [Chitinophagaceae bacterium]
MDDGLSTMDKKKQTDSGIEIKKSYDQGDVSQVSPLGGDLEGAPGTFPFTRGIQPDMYRGKLWTMRQYAGFSTAEESNQRYHYLLSQGVNG